MKSCLSLVSILFLAASCSSPVEEKTPVRSPVSARLEAVLLADHADTFEAGGSIRARAVAVLSSRIVAPVVAVRADAGNRVRAGQALILLDDRVLQAERARAEAALAAARQAAVASGAERQAATASLTLATASHARMAMLRSRNSATAGEFDEAVAALRAAEARVQSTDARSTAADRAVDAAKAALQAAAASATYAVVAAPFDGVVTARAADPGSLASPGTPLLTVEEDRGFQLHLYVDTSRTAPLAPGARIAVSTDGTPELHLEGIVTEIGHAFDPVTHTALVKIDLPATDGVRTGLFARARLPGSIRQIMTVTGSALLRRGQLSLVFVEDDGTARMRFVHAGRQLDGRVEILAGLTAGERVVLAPPPDLVDGTPLTLATAPAAGDGQ